MTMVGKMRRMYFRQDKSVREIARLTSLSRNTIRTWLREGEVKERQYRREMKPIKLTPFEETLRQALAADAHRPKRERRTALTLFKTIREQGYTGGLLADDRLCRQTHQMICPDT
jgi:transposase-like protein